MQSPCSTEYLEYNSLKLERTFDVLFQTIGEKY